MHFIGDFLYKYSFKFDKNPRMKMQIALLNKMPKEKLENHFSCKKVLDDILLQIEIFSKKNLFKVKLQNENRYL